MYKEMAFSTMFYALLNISSMNSYILHYSFCDNNKSLRSKCIHNLVRRLVEPHIMRRLCNQRLARVLRISIWGYSWRKCMEGWIESYGGKEEMRPIPNWKRLKNKFFCKLSKTRIVWTAELTCAANGVVKYKKQQWKNSNI